MTPCAALPCHVTARALQHGEALTRQLGESLYKSLENFTAAVEESRKKEVMRSAAMAEYQVGDRDSGLF